MGIFLCSYVWAVIHLLVIFGNYVSLINRSLYIFKFNSAMESSSILAQLVKTAALGNCYFYGERET